MAMGSGARKAIVWGGGALAGVGLLVASFFAGTAVGDNTEFEQAGTTAQEQDAGDNENRDLFDEQDTQGEQDTQEEGRDTQDADGEEQGPDGQGPERKDPDAEEGEGRHDGGHHGRHHDGHHDGDGGPDEDRENDSEDDGSAPA